MLQGGHFQRIPKVETLDNIIKNMQNLVQGKKYKYFTSGLTSDFRYWTEPTVSTIYAITSFP